MAKAVKDNVIGFSAATYLSLLILANNTLAQALLSNRFEYALRDSLINFITVCITVCTRVLSLYHI